MRSVIWGLAVATLGCGAGDDVELAASDPPTASPALDAEAEAVVASLQALFDALRTGDAELLRSVVDPGTVMHFTETGSDGRSSHGSSTLDGLADRIAASDAPLIERMWDPEVRIDGDLATIWTPYDFYVGDAFSHCGIDAATLVKRDDGWKIVGLSWTRRQPPECELHPDGPPGG